MAKAVWLTLCFLVWTTLAMKGEKGPKGDTGDFQNAVWKSKTNYIEGDQI